jgi:hypothetical protein
VANIEGPLNDVEATLDGTDHASHEEQRRD